MRQTQNKKAQQFISTHLYTDTRKLALKKSPFPDISMKELLIQIEGKRKAKEKIPSYFENEDVIYPSPVYMEQCSSEQTATYKASLCAGNQLVDLTGGFGVDTWMFSKKFQQVVYCEKEDDLVDIAKYNFASLQAQNIDVQKGDGLYFLKNRKQYFDWIYIDPSRRDQYNRKMRGLSDCIPNVVENLDLLLQYSDNIMLKTSPMLDIDRAISDLKHVKEVHTVAVKNEVREVLYLLKKGWKESINIVSINILRDKMQSFSFSKEELQETTAAFSMPQTFLYEPNRAVMKSGAFNLICKRYNVFKLHINSHLYTSNHYIADFSGKVFKIKEVLAYKPIKNLSQANISVRNFPDTSDEVRKKLKLRDGGGDYLFCTKLFNEKLAIVWCEKTGDVSD